MEKYYNAVIKANTQEAKEYLHGIYYTLLGCLRAIDESNNEDWRKDAYYRMLDTYISYKNQYLDLYDKNKWIYKQLIKKDKRYIGKWNAIRGTKGLFEHHIGWIVKGAAKIAKI